MSTSKPTEAVTTKLVKLLNMTTSDSDGEALNAIRIANDLLRKNGLIWELFFEGYDKPRETPYVPEDEVEATINYIYANAGINFNYQFVDSIRDNYQRYGKLTGRQMTALRRVFNGVKQYQGRGNG